jgi:hypothetical protein
MTTVESIKAANDGELLAFYNEFRSPNVKKFKNRDIAEKKCLKLLNEQLSRKGEFTVVAATENAAPKVETETVTTKRARVLKPETIARNEKHKADLEANKEERRLDRERRVAEKKAADEAKKNAPPVAKGPKPYAKPPRPEIIRPVTKGTRIANVIDLLSRPQGATEADLKACNIANSPRSWLAYDLNTVVGYGFESKDGVNFHLVLPTGMAAHLPHKVKIVVPAKETAIEESKAA